MIRFTHHDELEIHRIEYDGHLVIDELLAHAQFRAQNPQWLNYDHLNVVLPSTDASMITRGALEDLRRQHRNLFETEKLLILRRSAWVCLSPSALNLLQFWVDVQARRSDSYVDVRMFPTIDEAGRWLVLGAKEIALAKSGEGFRELGRFQA